MKSFTESSGHRLRARRQLITRHQYLLKSTSRCTLFTGQQWYSEIGLYDLRNRFYSPDLGRFLQPDPIGFWGDPTNLYRYCGNNSVTRSDPSGLGWLVLHIGGGGLPTADAQPVIVSDTPIGASDGLGGGVGFGGFGGGGGGEPGGFRIERVYGTDANGRQYDPRNGRNVHPNTLAPGLGQTDPMTIVGSLIPPAPLPGSGVDLGGGLIGGGGGETRLGDIFDYGPNNFIRRTVRYNNQHPAEAQSMVQFANALDYWVAYPAAGAVAAPMVGAGGMYGLAHPEFIVFAGGIFQQFTSPGGPIGTGASQVGFWLNYFFNRYVSPIGP